jgi:ribonuclease HI
MFFDRASSSEGTGTGVVLVFPWQETISLSYKIEFEASNNVAKYEALVLCMRDTKEMGIEEVEMFEDAYLIIQ